MDPTKGLVRRLLTRVQVWRTAWHAAKRMCPMAHTVDVDKDVSGGAYVIGYLMVPWNARQLHDVSFSSLDVPALFGLWILEKLGMRSKYFL